MRLSSLTQVAVIIGLSAVSLGCRRGRSGGLAGSGFNGRFSAPPASAPLPAEPVVQDLEAMRGHLPPAGQSPAPASAPAAAPVTPVAGPTRAPLQVAAQGPAIDDLLTHTDLGLAGPDGRLLDVAHEVAGLIDRQDPRLLDTLEGRGRLSVDLCRDCDREATRPERQAEADRIARETGDRYREAFLRYPELLETLRARVPQSHNLRLVGVVGQLDRWVRDRNRIDVRPPVASPAVSEPDSFARDDGPQGDHA